MKNNKTKSWFLLFILSLVWGSSFILMKKSLFDDEGNELLTADEVAALRIFISGIVLIIPFFRNLDIAFGKKWIYLLLVGFIGNLVPAFLFTHAELILSSTESGILNSLVPIFSALVATFIFNQNISMKTIGGVFLGLVGTVLLLVFNSKDINNIPFAPASLIVLATICYAFSLNIIKNKLSEVSSVAITGISLVFMLPFSIYFISTSDIPAKIIDPTYHQAFVLTTILAVVGTAFALIIFNHLIKISTSVFASSVTYLIPVVAILWGIYFGERITWAIWFIVIILIGILIIKKEEQKRMKSED